MKENLIYICLILNILFMLILIYLFVKYKRMFTVYNRLMRNKKGLNLDNKLFEMDKKIQNLIIEDRDNKEAIRALNKYQRASLQKIGIVKYNAFNGMGGNLSFSIAILDNTNSGFVLNSIHSKEGCFNYIKYVETGKTEMVLGKEEQEALEKALGY